MNYTRTHTGTHSRSIKMELKMLTQPTRRKEKETKMRDRPHKKLTKDKTVDIHSEMSIIVKYNWSKRTD